MVIACIVHYALMIIALCPCEYTLIAICPIFINHILWLTLSLSCMQSLMITAYPVKNILYAYSFKAATALSTTSLTALPVHLHLMYA